MYSGLCHNLSADMLTSRKKDIIKSFAQKSCIFFTSSFDHRHIRRIKTFCKNRFDNCGRGRREGTWFQDYRITGGNRIDQRIQRKQKRIVPWTHNKNYTVRNRFLITVRSKLCHRCRYILSLGIFSYMMDHMCKFT